MRKISTLMMLLLTLVAFNVVAQDTVAYYGYEAGTSVAPHGSLWTNTGKTYVTETVTGDSEGAYRGSGYFKAVVDHTPPNVWDNQSVFQEMPVEDSTCYRFCLRAKATAAWSDTTPILNITSGRYNGWADMNTRYGVEIAEEWTYYALMLYIGNTAELSLENSDGRYDDTVRFPIHFPAPGTYYLDEVALLKSTIAGSFYNGNLVKVDFGWSLDSDTTLDASKFSVSVGGSSVAVTKAGRYKYADSDTSYWESAVLLTLESSISQVSGTTVTVDFSGDDDMYYLSDGPITDDDGHVASFSGEVAYYDAGVVDNTLTSIKNKTAGLAFDIFPNPAQSELTVTAECNIASVEIYDISGKQVQTTNVKGTNSINLDVADLHSGIYLVRVTDVNGNVAAKKLVK